MGMVKDEEVFLVPGTGQYVKNYGAYRGADVWCGQKEISPTARVFIGHSLGAHFILSRTIDPSCRFILINPLIKKRKIVSLFFRWIRFLISEGISKKKLVPSAFWFGNMRTALQLLKLDIFKEFQKIPKENLIIIRGDHDAYFCTEEDISILREQNYDVREVAAGHDWNENIKNAVTDILRKM